MKIKVDCFSLKSTQELLRAVRCGVDAGPVCTAASGEEGLTSLTYPGGS